MELHQQFGFKELFTHIIADMAKAVCVRNGETPQQQFIRSQAATRMILGLEPRDVVEAMIAGHAVMFHEVMTDSVRDTLTGEMDTMRRATRSNIIAMDKAFGTNLTRLQRYQNRPAEGSRDAPDIRQQAAPAPSKPQTQAPARTGVVQPVTAPRNASAPPPPPAQTRGAPVPVQPGPANVAGTPLNFTPSPEEIAACRANPEAMAALEAGDADRFVRAMGLDESRSPTVSVAATNGPHEKMRDTAS